MSELIHFAVLLISSAAFAQDDKKEHESKPRPVISSTISTSIDGPKFEMISRPVGDNHLYRLNKETGEVWLYFYDMKYVIDFEESENAVIIPFTFRSAKDGRLAISANRNNLNQYDKGRTCKADIRCDRRREVGCYGSCCISSMNKHLFEKTLLMGSIVSNFVPQIHLQTKFGNCPETDNRPMIHSETKYAAPELELMELLMEQVIAKSGDIDDYDNEDFDWE